MSIENSERSSQWVRKAKKWFAGLSLAIALTWCNPSPEQLNRRDFERVDTEMIWKQNPMANWDKSRWWKAYYYELEDWTKVYWLTRNEIWYFSTTEDKTYYPEEISEIKIKPNWDTVAIFKDSHVDRLSKYKKYDKVPKSRIKPFKENFPDFDTSNEKNHEITENE